MLGLALGLPLVRHRAIRGDVAFLTTIVAHLELVISPRPESFLLRIVVLPSLVDLVIDTGKLLHEMGKLPLIFLEGFIIILLLLITRTRLKLDSLVLGFALSLGLEGNVLASGLSLTMPSMLIS